MKRTFEQWLATARRGDRFEYHRGDLVYDGTPEFVGPAKAVPVMRARHRAWQGYQTGRCTLVQKRHWLNDYSYIAVRL